MGGLFVGIGELDHRCIAERLAEVEADFAKNLDLLKRNVLNEDEFNNANVARRGERVKLTEQQVEQIVRTLRTLGFLNIRLSGGS